MAKTKLLLTEQALRDLAEIEAYSIAQLGKRTADRYLTDLEAALVRIQEKPDLLCPGENLPKALMFYYVNKHVFICDSQPQAIILLTVIHASRDIPSRLAEMEPTLAAEAELLQEQLKRVDPDG